MRKLLPTLAALLLLGSGEAFAQTSQPVYNYGANSNAPINISTATTTQLVAGSGTKWIYVSHWDVVAAGSGNIQLEYGTGATCTSPVVLTGSYNLAAQAGISAGDGMGAVLIIPAGNSLCAVTSAAVQMSGTVAYSQW